jgi:hypothetical protein
MARTLAFGLAALIACHGLAAAQGQGDGQYVLTQPGHRAKANKVEALTVKQKSVERKKAPVRTELCVPPGGGKPRRC